MKLMPQGDYYVWYCDWCDSRNRTLWARIDRGEVTCGACYASNVISQASTPEQGANAA